MTAPVSVQWTVDALHALPGGGLDYEVVDGQRHRMAFHTASHDNAIALLYHHLADYVARHQLGDVNRAPTELVISPRTLLRPDLIVTTSPSDSVASAPMLVVEILSPSTAALDRGAKRIQYQQIGVADLWLVDHHVGAVEHWRAPAESAEILDTRIAWCPNPSVVPFELFLPAFFGEVHLDD